MKLAVRRTTSAVVAFAAVGVSSIFLGAAPASAATEACGATGILIAPGVCEATFTSGTQTFTPTASMTKLEVLLVGAGGEGADQQSPNTNGYAAGGGGGGVRIVDFSGATDDLEITVATPAVTGSVTEGANPAETVYNGGNASFGGESGGFSGLNPGANGTSFSTTPYGAGAGAAGSPTDNANGGAGIVVSDLAASLTGSLFANDTNCYGGGGAIGTATVVGIPGCGAGGPSDTTGTLLTAPVANRGGGGGGVILAGAANRAGADGVVVVRFTAANVSLAFAANGHGTAPATQTVAAGAAAARPADPTAPGYTFGGWYTDAQLTTLADFAAPVTGSTTYYARWTQALAATGVDLSPAVVPIGLAALVAGAGLVVLANRRRTNSH